MRPLPLMHTIAEDDSFVYGLVDPARYGPQIVRSFSEIFGREFSLAEHDWYRLGHPHFPGRVHAAYHKASGRMAGISCSETFRYRLGSSEQRVDIVVTSGTFPDFRRMGVFSSLTNVIVEYGAKLGAAFGISFPNPYARNSYPAFRKAGWSVGCEFRFFEKRSFGGSLKGAKLVEHFDQRFDSLFEQALAHFDFWQIKDHRLLNWRYLRRPDTVYNCYAIEDGGLCGLVVLKRFSGDSIPKAHVIDFIALSEDVGERLLSAAQCYAHGSELLNIAVAVGSPWEPFFESCGFKADSRRYPVVMKAPAGKQVPTLCVPWITLGDIDTY